jgi:hypothetical protein
MALYSQNQIPFTFCPHFAPHAGTRYTTLRCRFFREKATTEGIVGRLAAMPTSSTANKIQTVTVR